MNEDIFNQKTAGDPGAPRTEGFIGLPGGMHAGLDPAVLSNVQYAFGVNTVSRGGLLKTRPPLRRHQAYIPSGRWQGAKLYRRDNVDRLVYCVDGTVYTYNMATGATYRAGTFPTVDFAKAFFCQADRYMIVQNGIAFPEENWPILIDGDYLIDNADIQYFSTEAPEGWRYLGDHEDYEAVRVPIGTVMAFGQGRLFVVVARIWDTWQISGTKQWIYQNAKRAMVASNIIQSDNPPEILAFVENTYLAEGCALELPAGMGDIYGLTFFRQSSTGTGLGALVAFGSEGTAGFAVNAPRTQWKDIDLSQVLFQGNGTESCDSVVPVNDDLAYRASDGWRFVKYSQAQAQGGTLSSIPQSFEISPVLERDSRLERYFTSAAFVDNRLLMLAAGEDARNGDTVFAAVASLDTAAAGSVSEVRNTPVYDGIWTGQKFLTILKARIDYVDKAFVFVRIDTDPDDLERNELWYFCDPVADSAEYADGLVTPPECRIATKLYNYNLPALNKEFKYAEYWLSSARGSCELETHWRADRYDLWNPCQSYAFDACVTAEDSLPQSRWRLRLPPSVVPTGLSGYDPVSGRDVRMGTVFQFCLGWSGSMTIEKALYVALPQTSPTPDTGCDTPTCVPLLEGDGGLVIDYYDYLIPRLTPLRAQAITDMSTLGREPLFFWEFVRIEEGQIFGNLIVVGPGTPGSIAWPSHVRPVLPSTTPPATRTPFSTGTGGVSGGGGAGVGGMNVPNLPLGAIAVIPTVQPVGSPSMVGSTFPVTPWPPAVGSEGSYATVLGTAQGTTTSAWYISASLNGAPSMTLYPGQASEWLPMSLDTSGELPEWSVEGVPVKYTIATLDNKSVVSSDVTLEFRDAVTKEVIPFTQAGTITLGGGKAYEVRATLSAAYADVDRTFTYVLGADVWYPTTAGIPDDATYKAHVEATITIAAKNLSLLVSPTTLTKTLVLGYSADTSTITLSVDSTEVGASVDWTAALSGDIASHATVSPAYGTALVGTPSTLTVTYTAGAPAGSHTGTLTVTDSHSKTYEVPVTFTVVPIYRGDIRMTTVYSYYSGTTPTCTTNTSPNTIWRQGADGAGIPAGYQGWIPANQFSVIVARNVETGAWIFYSPSWASNDGGGAAVWSQPSALSFGADGMPSGTYTWPAAAYNDPGGRGSPNGVISFAVTLLAPT